MSIGVGSNGDASNGDASNGRGPYGLGVDLGTTYTAAAVSRSGVVTMASLGGQSVEMPTVVAITDEATLVGETASRRALSDPRVVTAEFKRRIGDPSPVLVGDVERSPESLMADVLEAVLESVAAAEGCAPSELAVTYPAAWGVYKLERLDEVLATAGWPNATTLSEPEAAARHYFAQQELDSGATVAVFDFGGGTFDAAVLRNTTGGEFALLGEVLGLERLGGVDLDEAVLRHVVTQLEIGPLTGGESTVEDRAIARLRAECTAAREALSSDTATTISVMLPGRHEEIRLTRQEFETMIRPAIADAIAVVDATIEAAGLAPTDLDAVLLVGGVSRTPLVSQMVRSHFDRPTLVDAHPKHTVASGAALMAVAADPAPAPASPAQSAPAQSAPTQFPPATAVVESAPTSAPDQVEPVAAQSEHVDSAPGGVGESPRRRALLAVTFAALAIVVLGSLALASRGGEDGSERDAPRAQDAVASEASSPSTDLGSAQTPSAAVNSSSRFAEVFATDFRTDTAGEFQFNSRSFFAADGPVAGPGAVWARDGIGGPVLASSVAGNDGLVYTLEDRDGIATLVALGLETGDEAWVVPVEWASDLLLAGEAVIVITIEGVVAFDRSTGDRLGFIGGQVEGSITGVHVRGNRALVGSTTATTGEPVVEAWLVDLDTNEHVWNHEESFALALDLSLFVANDVTMVLGTGDEVVARDIGSNEELWRTRDFGSFDVALLTDNVLVVNLAGDIVGLDVASGGERWRRQGFTFQHAADDRHLYTMNSRGELEALSLDTGATMWAIKPSPRPSGRVDVVVGNSHVYVVQSEGDVTAHRSDTGAVVWTSTLDGTIGGEFVDLYVAVVDEYLVIVDADTMVAFGVAGDDGGNTDQLVASDADPGADPESSSSGLSVALGDASTIPTPLASFNSGGDPFLEPGPSQEPTLLWQINRPATGVAAVVADGYVLYPDSRESGSTTSGYIVAVDAITGAEVWATRVGTIFRLHTTDTTVVAHTFDGLVGVDIATGERVADADIPSPPIGTGAVVRDGALIVGSTTPQEPNFVDSIDIATGATNWVFEDSSASVGGVSQLFVGDEVAALVLERSVVGVDLRSGEELWRSTEFGGSDVILMRDDRLLVRLDFGNLAVLDASTGEQQWSGGAGGFGIRDDGSAYYSVATASERLVKTSLASGEPIWSVNSPVESGPLTLISNDVVYLIDRDGLVAAHRSSDGALLWSMSSGIQSRTGLRGAVGSDVLVLTDGGQISVIG